MSAATFHYSARTATGEPVSGTLRAQSPTAALSDLRRRALFVTALGSESGVRPQLARARVWTNDRNRALVAFFRAFSTLLHSGVTIRRALVVCIERCLDPVLRESLRAVVADVEQGAALSVAMSRRPREFASLYVAMIRAGEAGGVLDDVLARIAGVLEREHALRKRLASALAYPAVVALAASALGAFMLIHVAPLFAEMFAKFGVSVPAPTRMLVSVGRALAAPGPWLALAIACIGVAAMLIRLHQDSNGKLLFDRIRLRIPVFGALVRAAAVARIARMLGALLRSGVGILAALEVLGPVAGSPIYAAALAQVADALRRGEPLMVPMRRTGAFDPLVVALVGAGEETGAVDQMFLAVADYLDVEVEATIATLAAILEPALIVFLGCVVGLIVFSIFIPLYGLIGSIS
ncbi:MAG: type II secretion system F family protein [Candidatus Eremiobacteraeota bacterium]|nr:type II secretion system F family protein [Candidatus Eremiobacteraeota bacterium]MBV8354548.1 type II secretion system F family protein [Candidatus Eremiobacteraeota bacterium]